MVISDDDILAMPDEQRRDLVRRLTAASGRAVPARLRRWHLMVTAGSAVLLVPWIGYLLATLPSEFTVHNWKLAWVGFDLLMLAMFATTAVLSLRRHRLAVLIGFALGVLLICDAGFDLVTSHRAGLPGALASAVLVELPLAALLMTTATLSLGRPRN